MATPSENSLPDLDLSDPVPPDAISPSTPPLQPTKGDRYYNFPPARIPLHPELSSSTTNISMQPNPMYQDFPPGAPPPAPNSEKQIVVEKIKEGNPDALSTSTLLENNVKVYERIDSYVPRRRSFLPRHTYSPEKKKQDSDYQYLSAVKGDGTVKSTNIVKIGLQTFYSILLIITLFIAVIALAISIVCLSDLSRQRFLQNASYTLEELEPIIAKSSAYKELADRIENTRGELHSLRLSSQASILALNQTENCFLRESTCLIEDRKQMCGTDPLLVGESDRITGIACVTSHIKAEPNLVLNNQTGAYTCQCFIGLGQAQAWNCSLYLWACNGA